MLARCGPLRRRSYPLRVCVIFHNHTCSQGAIPWDWWPCHCVPGVRSQFSLARSPTESQGTHTRTHTNSLCLTHTLIHLHLFSHTFAHMHTHACFPCQVTGSECGRQV